MNLAAVISQDLSLSQSSVNATLELLNEGATVPFIARYRKERTGALDEVQIRDIQEKNTYYTELEDRKNTILSTIEEQGKLTPELKKSIQQTLSKTELEDLYLPYKPKRRTRAQMAREKGLEPLAKIIFKQGHEPVDATLKSFVSEDVKTPEEALQGAQDIVAEDMTENAKLRASLRERLEKFGSIQSKVTKKFKDEPSKFEQYYEFSEALQRIPSHRYLALRRGESEGVLKLSIDFDPDHFLTFVERQYRLRDHSPWADALRQALQDGYKRLLFPSIEKEILTLHKEQADHTAIEVFATNLQNLLLASPLGEKSVVGVDPGLRTGSKCVALDNTGKFLDHITLYSERGSRDRERAQQDFVAFVKKHRPEAIAIGNGTGSREIEKHIRSWLKGAGLEILVVQVNEAGASIYSASDIAREEFPDLDLTLRGAISIARRLQDPLAELVKIDPKSIGVGQYQHDVAQNQLKQKLHDVVESCVNQVGVEVNTASAPLLAYVAGVGPSLAKKIVSHRENSGAFGSRQALLKVSGLGKKAFEQAAGFLRVRQSDNPLDRSAVHPERYALVKQMAKDVGVPLGQLVGNAGLVKQLNMTQYETQDVGQHTLKDIINELQKPGRDPRAQFEAPKFRDDVHTMDDLKKGMVLEGVVTNVAAFGAFVDLGVHQDGLVHISQLANRFVKDPHEVVSVGDKLKVKVLEVDTQRKRISLTAKEL